jgi:hypothetical protein
VLFGAACLALCILPRPAAAAALSATLTVERSERAGDCPDAPALTRQVEHILQRALKTDPASAELEVQVRFSWSRDQYWADVVSRGPKPGERVLRDRGQSCAALAEAVSVAIALLLDRELASRVSGADEQRLPSDAAAPKPPALAKPVSNAERASQRAPASLELRAALEAGGALGLVGKSSALLAEELGVRFQSGIVLDAGFSAVLPRTMPFGEGSVRTTLLFGTARACYAWGERFRVGPCASFGIGQLRGVGIGYPSVASQNLTWTAFGAGAVAEGPMWERVFWGISGTLWLPSQRSSFSVQNVGTAWESSPVGGALALRLGFRIW